MNISQSAPHVSQFAYLMDMSRHVQSSTRHDMAHQMIRQLESEVSRLLTVEHALHAVTRLLGVEAELCDENDTYDASALKARVADVLEMRATNARLQEAEHISIMTSYRHRGVAEDIEARVKELRDTVGGGRRS